MPQSRKTRMRMVWKLWPAIFVLGVNLLWSLFLGNISLSIFSGSEAFWKVPFRFARFSFAVLLPLLLLFPIFTVIGKMISLGAWKLIATNAKGSYFSEMKSWFVRPLQGIGLSLLLGSKLVGVLQSISAIETGAAGVLPPAQFMPARMLTTIGIMILVSFILLLFWTLDDLGIRQVNEKTNEVRMTGRYLGILLPVLFGVTGFLSLLPDLPASQAIQYILQLAVALYPPFVILAVCHAAYIQNKSGMILKRLQLNMAKPSELFQLKRETPEGSESIFPG